MSRSGQPTIAQQYGDPALADELERARRQRMQGHDPEAAFQGEPEDVPTPEYQTTAADMPALLRDLSAHRTADGTPAWVLGTARAPVRDIWGKPKGDTPRYTLRTLQLAIAAGYVQVREPRGDMYRLTPAGLAALEGAS